MKVVGYHGIRILSSNLCMLSPPGYSHHFMDPRLDRLDLYTGVLVGPCPTRIEGSIVSKKFDW